jgi:hypothetical protein
MNTWLVTEEYKHIVVAFSCLDLLSVAFAQEKMSIKEQTGSNYREMFFVYDESELAAIFDLKNARAIKEKFYSDPILSDTIY